MEKHNFNIGDEVICIPGFTCNSVGGFGYKEGKIFKIKSISGYDKGGMGDCLWPVGGGNGIYARAVKLNTEEPQYEIY